MAAETNSLITALRAATPQTGPVGGFRFYANPANGSAVTPKNYTGMAFNPAVLTLNTVNTGGNTGGNTGNTGGGGGDDSGRTNVQPNNGLDIIEAGSVYDPLWDGGTIGNTNVGTTGDTTGDVTVDTTGNTTGDVVNNDGLVIDESQSGNGNTSNLDLSGTGDFSDLLDGLSDVDFGTPDRIGVVDINQDNIGEPDRSSFEDPFSVDAVNGSDLDSDLFGINDDPEFLQQLERLNSQDAGAPSDTSSDFWNWSRRWGVDDPAGVGAGGGGGLTVDDLLELLNQE